MAPGPVKHGIALFYAARTRLIQGQNKRQHHRIVPEVLALSSHSGSGD
jgi:hypothetical protein